MVARMTAKIVQKDSASQSHLKMIEVDIDIVKQKKRHTNVRLYGRMM